MPVWYDGSMHRTTINLDEGVYKRIMALTRKNRQPMARTIEALLRKALAGEQKRSVPTLPLHSDNGPQRGVDITDRDRLYELMEEP